MWKLITVALCSVALVGGVEFVAAKGNDNKGQQGQEHGKGHKHHQNNGHNLLGAKLKQDGKHGLGKLKDRDVVAEVKGGKVHNMTAGDLPVKRVKTKEKVVLNGGLLQLASNGPIQLAQYDDYYYGYCFYDEYDYYCYWYPSDDVDYQDYEWEDYDPYY